jgi:hypothetical protein
MARTMSIYARRLAPSCQASAAAKMPAIKRSNSRGLRLWPAD